MDQPLELLVIGRTGEIEHGRSLPAPLSMQVVGLKVIPSVRLGVVVLGLPGVLDRVESQHSNSQVWLPDYRHVLREGKFYK